jgi:hypothetical protein
MSRYVEMADDLRDIRWWLCEEDEQLAEVLRQHYKSIRDNDGPRLTANQHFKRLYGGYSPGSLTPSNWSRVAEENPLALNVVKAAIDAVTAKIAKQTPIPRPITQGGNPSLRRKAKLLERFLLAQFQISRVYEEATKSFLDAGLFGTGVLHTAPCDGEIVVERVHPNEIFVDPFEARYGRPKTLYRKKWIDRETLIGLFPKKRELIVQAGRSDAMAVDDNLEGDYDRTADQLLVIEGWHLGTGKQKGRHAIVVDTGALLVDEWEYDYLPFVFFRWSEDPDGFWGTGAAEDLNGLQVEINRLLTKIQSAFHLLAVPRVFVQAGSKLTKSHYDNRVGAIIPYMGQPPIVATPQTIHPELFQHLDRLYSRAFEIVGVSQLSVAGRNPLAGDVSGVALDTFHDIETERFSIIAKKFERAIRDVGLHLIDCAKEIGGDFSAPAARDRNTIDWLKWSDVQMEDDEYVLHVESVSSLPSTPAGRMRWVVTMLNAGLIEPKRGLRLLDFPDVEQELALDQAAENLIDSLIERMLDEGIYTPPEPFMDLQLALKKGQLWYNRALEMNVENDRLELLINFMTQARMLMVQAMVEQQKLAAQVAGMNQPMNNAAPPPPGVNGQPPGAVTPQDGVMPVG